MALLAGSVAGCQPSDESSTGGVDATDQTDISDSSDLVMSPIRPIGTDPSNPGEPSFQSKLNSWRKAFQVYKK